MCLFQVSNDNRYFRAGSQVWWRCNNRSWQSGLIWIHGALPHMFTCDESERLYSAWWWWWLCRLPVHQICHWTEGVSDFLIVIYESSTLVLLHLWLFSQFYQNGITKTWDRTLYSLATKNFLYFKDKKFLVFHLKFKWNTFSDCLMPKLKKLDLQNVFDNPIL